jgi:hypothetical protein
MDNYLQPLIILFLGYFMGIISIVIGACLMSKATKNRVLFPDVLEPKGDAFTVETPEDMALFPDDFQNEAEEHILQKTNKFLERLNAGHSAEDK